MVLFFIGIFLASLLIPKVTLYFLEDKAIDKMVKTTSNVFASYNSKSENAVIKTVYSKYNNEKYSISTGDRFLYTVPSKEIDGETFTNDTLVKLKELENLGILEPSFFNDISKHPNMITRTNDFKGENFTYSKNRIFLPNDNYKNAFMSFEVENITGKIIELKIPKEYLNTTKDMMESYIKYLGLNDMDWIYETNSISSRNKKIQIKIEDINNIISVNLVPYNN